MVKKGDEVITKSPLWHQGQDVGDRLGRVISTTGYVLVELYDYENNPVKCFRNEIEKADRSDWEKVPEGGLFDDLDVDNLPLDLFNMP